MTLFPVRLKSYVKPVSQIIAEQGEFISVDFANTSIETYHAESMVVLRILKRLCLLSKASVGFFVALTLLALFLFLRGPTLYNGIVQSLKFEL